MDDGPYWVILLMYESHDMRHIGFCRLTMIKGTPGFLGVTCFEYNLTSICSYLSQAFSGKKRVLAYIKY